MAVHNPETEVNPKALALIERAKADKDFALTKSQREMLVAEWQKAEAANLPHPPFHIPLAVSAVNEIQKHFEAVRNALDASRDGGNHFIGYYSAQIANAVPSLFGFCETSKAAKVAETADNLFGFAHPGGTVAELLRKVIALRALEDAAARRLVGGDPVFESLLYRARLAWESCERGED